jgi:outer membrane protein TolC
MIYNCFNKKLLYLIVCVLAGLCALNGCGSKDYKKDADERVYKILDKKWKDEYGTKANYKISDTEPLPDDIQVEKAVPASGILTLPQAVAIATAHNHEYHIQKEELYIKALDLRLTRHEFEMQFFGNTSGGYAADRNDDAYGFEGGFGFKRLLATGARLSSRVVLAYIDVLSGNLNSGMATILSATVAQPLLRGSSRKVALENLDQAERDVLYQVRLFNRYRKTFVVSVISQYYLVLQQYDTMKNAQRNYNTLKWLHNKVDPLVAAGRVPKLELEQIRQEMLQALNIYILIEKEYKQALDEFKITLSLPTTAEFQLDAKELETLRATEMAYPDFFEAEAVETALARRLDLANNADAVIDAERKVYVAADGLRADANLVGYGNFISSGKGDRRGLNPLRKEYGLGIELSLPLDRVAEQNTYRKALITLSQKQREYEQASDTVKLEVRQAYRDLKEAAQSYRVQTEGFKLADKRLKNTFLLLQYSRASSRRFLNAQNDLFDAQNAATEALVNYMIATLNFYRDTEVLQVRPDGMWEKGTDRKVQIANTVGLSEPAINQKKLSLMDSFAPRMAEIE